MGREPRPAELSAHFFDAFATAYDAWFCGLHRRVAERLVALAAPRPGEVCLDVGCGTGLVARGLAETVGADGHVDGLDVSEGMLALARAAALPNTTFHHASAEPHLPFRDGTFDLVTFCDSLAYMDDPGRLLEEARRVLRPSGRIALALRWRSLDTAAQEVFFRLLDRLTEDHPVVIPQQRDSRGLLGEPPVIREVLRQAGFRRPWTTGLVSGDRLASAAEWLDFMACTGPRPYALITTLVPGQRRRLEQRLAREMERLGDEAYRHHQAYTLAGAEAGGRGPGPFRG
ncbi:MAG TPA: methyltransferase domain-containing protein [Candidatus Dormibacteraeota bacterium]|nr:methyltransferase domain-containing protein [Candidatus Dormibacteraeota bacterium]